MSGIDTGDVVFHAPSGETWTVAFVEGDRLAWCGWPEGLALLSDCTLVEKASAEQRQSILRSMAGIPTNDSRQRYAQRVLEEESRATVKEPQ